MAGLTHGGDWRDWLPIRIWREADAWSVDWCHFGKRPLRESFFCDSVELALRRPFNLAFRQHTGIDALLEWQQRSPGLSPTAFILHASRCGSTLMAQMLARLDSHVVLSEPPPLDALLRAHRLDPGAASWQPGAIRALLSALAQPRQGGERALVVKLDAWSLFELPLLRRCFPDTPWVFLYRDPLEIAISQLHSPGRHMVPGLIGTSLPGLPPGQAASLSRAEFVARTLGNMLAAGFDHCVNHGGLALNYTELPQAVGERFAGVLGLGAEDAATTLAGLHEHAKRRGEPFEPDRERKQQAADDAIRTQVQRWAQPPYWALEKLRMQQRTAATTGA